MKTQGKTEPSHITTRYADQLDALLNRRPILVALAGPNGAGKTTFYHAHLKPAGLRFLNADEISRELEIERDETPIYVSVESLAMTLEH